MLLTGATGFLGMELLARYLEHTDRPVYALVRAPASQGRATRRLRRTLHCLFGAEHPYGERVVAVRGDITTRRPRARARRVAARRPRQRDRPRRRLGVLRAAAGRQSRAINVGGTRRMLEFAELCQAAGRAAALHLHLHRVRRRRARRAPSARTTSTSASAFATPTSGRSSRPRGSSNAGARGCRSRSCARASSWASATAAGRRRSTSSTGRCARSRAAPTGVMPARAVGARRRRAGRLRGRRDLRAQPGAAGARARPST